MARPVAPRTPPRRHHCRHPARNLATLSGAFNFALERAWVLDQVPAWLPTQNDLKRLASMPKHHLADPALAAAALSIDADALLSPAPLRDATPRADLPLGRLFESLVTQSVRIYAQAAIARVGHLRRHREIDLIVERRFAASSRSRSSSVTRSATTT